MTQDNPTETSQPMDVQDILKQLEVNEGTFPREAVLQAIEQREAITPELLRILEDARDNIEYIAEHDDYFAHIYAMYLLAQFREPRAYPLLTQFFAMPEGMAKHVTGEIVTESLGRILASVSGGDSRLMMELAENESADDYVRSAALQGLICLVVSGDKTREDVIAYFQSFFRGRLPREYTVLWDLLISSSTDLYPEELYEDIKQAYEEGLIESFFIGIEDVESTLKQGKERVLENLQNNRHYSLITDTVSELEWWACFQPKDRLPRTTLPNIPVPKALPNIPFPTPVPVVQTATKKSKSRTKDKAKRKQVKASRRKNRR
ncbi:MAG: hypothetical protein ETSY2_40850 [Candidatus Entotheonella gemina]|uniref:DUF1186 domain-containing protein n=1 Tax=Candidatus Entotheonella gemina TaxID=1429439 RepID=W4LMZ3_9BACT|nr:MAG: hypothetical protein ETSY2_40850 [Candidatus Entotheonella gemina]